jgi:S-(hydroxymethyl)glutathione dehydrogenase/alcohol dehydrogenase
VVRAVVLPEVGAPVEVRDIALPEPGAGAVRVRLAAAGVCHSDLSLADGTLRQKVPAVLGHEGAGTVTAVGPGVDRVAAGDRVLLNWAPPCRACWWCTHGEPHLCEHALDAASAPYAALPDGSELFPGLGTAAFADETVVPATACIPLPDDVSLDVAALLGCAVVTGVGAVLNEARVQPGESVLVLGLGGVGLSAVQGARIADAGQVVAADISPGKESLARALGATDFLVAGDDVAKQVRALTDGRGVDHAIECVGRGSTIRAAWSSTRRGGRTTVVGIGRKDDPVPLSALEVFHFGRTLSGCVFGSSDPDRDVPLLLDHWRAGRLDLEGLVTHRVGLDGVAEAFARMRAGEGGRTIVVP